MTPAPVSFDSTSFSAGQQCGARLAACIARVSALELVAGSRWWNRRRHRMMARALVACAEELESAADAGTLAPSPPIAPGPTDVEKIRHGPTAGLRALHLAVQVD